MKNSIEILNRIMKKCIKLTLAATSLLFAMFVFCNASHAQAEPARTEVHDRSLKSYKLPPKLKKYWQEKYKDQIEDVTSSLQETPQGPRGTLHIRGHVKTKTATTTHEDKLDSTREIAQSFLKDESELLGLPGLNELREVKIETDMGRVGEYTYVSYARYIGDLPLDGATVHIEVGPDNTIFSVVANLVSVPAELYQAVLKKTISEGNVRQIVEKNLRAKGIDLKNIVIPYIKEYAISSHPYVVWEVHVVTKTGLDRWKYVIDAIKADIIAKQKYFIPE